MGRLIELGALRGERVPADRAARVPVAADTLHSLGEQSMRSYEMTEIGVRGLEACLTEAFAIATDECAACS
jgi:agmatinase